MRKPTRCIPQDCICYHKFSISIEKTTRLVFHFEAQICSCGLLTLLSNPITNWLGNVISAKRIYLQLKRVLRSRPHFNISLDLRAKHFSIFAAELHCILL
ncbi:hypothetical protein Y032_0287g1458 [Ancylostoma ceylanicum]|uniref:Uncharacterized protein n=1 Tax=Ancylostoma ceylanicum TaxID=53326 RepID=A0A016S5T5_9BILA|nr:hypothetical protein Y032_0287g1458 [Ancylostoma ceylanicum]